MGACTFRTKIPGDTARAAFRNAVERAWYEDGDFDGYTGTIAEKDRYLVITVPVGVTPEAWTGYVMDAEERGEEYEDMRTRMIKQGCPPSLVPIARREAERVLTKWGPCGAVRDGENWIFFGLAPS